jgi:hypothetical protein
VRYALKEARLQNPVLTNRNGIPRPYYLGKQPSHCDAPKQQKDKDNKVDSAVIGGREKLLPGEVLKDTCIPVKKSAEVIVVAGNEPPT